MSVGDNVRVNPIIQFAQNVQYRGTQFFHGLTDLITKVSRSIFFEIKETCHGIYTFFATRTFSEAVWDIAKKIVQFLRRHKAVFFTYAVGFTLMTCFGATAGQMAQALVPGFVWVIMNERGRFLPEDLLEEVRPSDNRSPQLWLPKRVEETADSTVLKDRLSLIEETVEWVENPNGWVLLHGTARIGKSVIADEILQRVAKKGQKVVKLSRQIYEAKTKNPYLTVAEELNRDAKKTGSPPLLFIDEFDKIPQDLFRAMYEKDLHFNILAVQSSLKESDFHQRFAPMIKKVPPLDVHGVITTLNKVKENRFPRFEIPDAVIDRLVKEIAIRLGNYAKEKLLYNCVKVLEHSCGKLEKETEVLWEHLQGAISKITLDKRNFVALIPPIDEKSFWVPRSAEDLNTSWVLEEQFQIIQDCTKRLSTYEWAYLYGLPRTRRGAVAKEVIRQLQKAGHPVYTINEHYYWEKKKFIKVDHMWDPIYKTMRIIGEFSNKKPILFINRKKNDFPEGPFRRQFKNASFHVFALDETEPHPSISDLFLDNIHQLHWLDPNTVTAICNHKFHEMIHPEIIAFVLDEVVIKLFDQAEIELKQQIGKLNQEEIEQEKSRLAFQELYFRTKNILKSAVKLNKFSSEEDIKEIIERQEWERRVYVRY